MSTARRAVGAVFGLALAALAPAGSEPDPPRGIGRWDALAYGHHRAVVRVDAPSSSNRRRRPATTTSTSCPS